MGQYLKVFETFTDLADPTKIRVHYRIDYNDRFTLIKTKDVPSAAAPANGNIVIIFELIQNSALPTAPVTLEEFPDAYLTVDWHNLPQPHQVAMVVIHDKGSDKESMQTTDPS